MLSQAIELKTTATPARENDPKISVLINSVHFFLSYVFIMEKDQKYWLVVLLDNKLVYDGLYDSIRGAKIAFSRYFKEKAWNENKKAQWSLFFQPDRPWFESNLEIAEKVH